MRAADLEPLEDYPGNNSSPWRCRCLKCEREVTPAYKKVKQGQGCRYCATNGIDLTAPAAIYLLRHDPFVAVKVGIAGHSSRYDRIEHHTQHGWVVVATWDVSTGEDAFNVEQAILEWWRDTLGAPAALTKDDMPQGGWTETAALLHVDIEETTERIQREVDALVLDTPADPS